MNAKSVLGWIVAVASLAILLVVLTLPAKYLGIPTFENPPFPPVAEVSPVNASINNLWLTVALILVVLMQPGFAFLESGFMRSRSAINVLFKNTIDFCLNGIFFFFVGYSLMWNGSSATTQLHGDLTVGWLPTQYAPYGIVAPIHFLFQLVFATTAATICSGLVAGRIQTRAYFIATVVISSLIYPISGFWVWAADAQGPVGFLNRMGYHDLAGSSVVHVVGGFAGLAGAIVLGPRLGRYRGDPKLIELRRTHKDLIPGLSRYDQGVHKPHSFTSATLGAFLLWVGWFGFNGGSVLAMSDGKEAVVGFVLINTMLAGCSGGITGALAPFLANWLTWLPSKKPTTRPFYSMDGMLNGIIGGLVAITAGCDLIKEPIYAVVIGLIAGLVVHLSTFTLNNLPPGWRVDDPVGAFSVHGACGMLGVMSCAAIPGSPASFWTQALGCTLLVVWSFGTAFLVFWVMNKLKMLRSKPEDEILGLDVGYHGQAAYTLET